MIKYLNLFITIAILVACSGSNNAPQQASSTANIEQQSEGGNPNWPTYSVGSELTYPPFEFVSDQHGTEDGFEIELLKAIAKEEKFNIRVTNTPRNTVYKTLDEGLCDIWASAFSINSETESKAELSRPFLDFEFIIYLLDNEKNKSINSLAAFKGKRIAVSKFSKYATDIATRLTDSPRNVIAMPSLFLALKEVYLGRVDGVLSDSRVLAYQKMKHPEIKMRSIALNEPMKQLVFMTKKGRKDLIIQINDGLEKVKANGTYAKLVHKWFGENMSNAK